MLWRPCEGGVGSTRGYESEFVGHRSHGLCFERNCLELLPFASLHFAAACQNERALQMSTLARTCGSAIVEHTRVHGAQESFLRCGIVDPPGHGIAIFHKSDGDRELGQS